MTKQPGTGPNGEVAGKHPLYLTWKSMRYRCTYKGHVYYANYGGAGIAVCDRWMHSFWAFVQDVGDKPTPDHTLERIRSSDGYRPGNVRWATRAEQSRNTRRNRWVTFGGETLCIADWAKRIGMARAVLGLRLKHGWSVERALTTPVRRSQVAA